MSVLAVLEQQDGVWNRMSFETLAAAQQYGLAAGLPVHAAVLGGEVGTLAPELANYQLEQVHAVQHELLAHYTPDAYTAALRQLIERIRPTMVFFPHTYQVRDFAPKLATAMRRVLISDVIAFEAGGGQPRFVRQLFQGKMNADVRFTGEPPCFASLQAGAWRADQTVPGTAPVSAFTPELKADQIRTRPLERFREAARAVDLSAADIIVSVGRGIKEADNLPLIETLVEVLGAELAASRPICDSGWLPMERQVGSSGQTVAPKIYFAIGISGAIQHLVGMKGSKTIVAVNRDPEAPIFEVADYGIVGDLFEVVPALVEELRKAKG
ncbi:MAG: electron transfer flavoprotein subunit alpha/FixB family protein [Acidobacteriota bacterium]|nr:electron transfer flavoprotein subunit alpha/FixB family protein [Acidobacteriota bacterium]